MNSNSYTTYRIISQVLSIVIAASSIISYISFSVSEIDKIEIMLTSSKPTFLLGDMGCYIIAVNILFALISACCITSKFKIWMRLFKKTMLIQIAFNLCTIIYFYFFYPSSIIFSMASPFMASSNTNLNSALLSIGVLPYRGDIKFGFEKHVLFYIKIFCILQLIGIVATIANVNIFGRTLDIELENKSKVIPKVDENKRVGKICNTPKFQQIISLRPVPVR